MEQPQPPSENSLIKERRDKLAKLREKGIDPFKNKFTPDHTCDDARSKFDKGEIPEGTKVSVAGRITAHRDMGKSIFIDVRDQSGRVQIYAQKQALGDEQFDIFKHLDLGDFVGVTGTMFRTKTNEPSIKLGGTDVPGIAGVPPASERVSREQSQPPFVILAKALRPPPAKWHGLEDTEIRYRQRYLDLMGNPEVKQTFLQRSAIVHEIRQFFHGRGYVEVETPAMQAIPGGAAAQPFKTFHNALGCDFYLRIALELYHKRLLVGGIDKLFEIGKNFRNEGLSRRHNPEFTMLEAYCAFGDCESMMETVEALIKQVAAKVFGTHAVQHARWESIDACRAWINIAVGKLKDSNGEPSFFRPLEGWLSTFDLGARSQSAVEYAKVLIDDAEHFCIEFSGVPQAKETVEEVRKQQANVKDHLAAYLIDLAPAWRRVKYKDLVKEKAGTDWFDISPAERRQRAHDLGVEIGKEYEDFEVTGAVFEKLIEPTLIQPTFVTHLPKELVPLAKLSPDDPTTVEVFECCINGQEIAPGYTEQNDPIAQRNTLEHQAGGEQQKLDEDFLVALEHGMPPAGGIGIGIDRLCMMLLGQESIRDVILFPQLKPK
ncbi:MAG TPA: lysine--tRNA ligase [Candidatus Limnocylindria bacterium]|nr:lysine--tRNA ligase [Candidatus Limnocylindria bacterium]